MINPLIASYLDSGFILLDKNYMTSQHCQFDNCSDNNRKIYKHLKYSIFHQTGKLSSLSFKFSCFRNYVHQEMFANQEN